MNTYYHVHWDKDSFKGGSLSPGQNITLSCPFKGPPSPHPEDVDYWRGIESTANSKHPKGVSFWGKKLYLGLLDGYMGKFEHILENVRLQHFPQRLSRLESFFCLESVSGAKAFCDTLKLNAEIWEVQHEGRSERLDMNWIKKYSDGESDHVFVNAAINYWKGTESESPAWEVLLSPPARIMQCVASVGPVG